MSGHRPHLATCRRRPVLSPIQDTRRDQTTPPGLHRPARFWIRAGDTSIALARPRTVQPPSSSAARTVESNTELPDASRTDGRSPPRFPGTTLAISPRGRIGKIKPTKPQVSPGVHRDSFNQLCNVEPIALDHTQTKRVPLTPYEQSTPPRPPTTHISPRPPLRHRQLHSAPIHLQPDRPLPPPLPPPTPTQTEPPRLVRPSGG